MKTTYAMMALVLGIPNAVLAIDMPSIEPGLWEVAVVVDGQPQGTLKQCVDADTAQQMLNAGEKMLADRCSPVEMQRDGASYVSSVKCDLGISKMEANTTLSGDFSRQYVSETKTTFNPPMMGKERSVSRSEGKWVGECPADMKPGDTVMADGRKLNMLEMIQKMPKGDALQRVDPSDPSRGIDLKDLQRNMPDLEEFRRSMQTGE